MDRALNTQTVTEIVSISHVYLIQTHQTHKWKHLYSVCACLSNFYLDIQNPPLWISKSLTCTCGWCVCVSDLKGEIALLTSISYSVPFLLLYFIFICLSLLSLPRLFNQIQTLSEGLPAISKPSQSNSPKGREGSCWLCTGAVGGHSPWEGEREVREKN